MVNQVPHAAGKEPHNLLAWPKEKQTDLKEGTNKESKGYGSE